MKTILLIEVLGAAVCLVIFFMAVAFEAKSRNELAACKQELARFEHVKETTKPAATPDTSKDFDKAEKSLRHITQMATKTMCNAIYVQWGARVEGAAQLPPGTIWKLMLNVKNGEPVQGLTKKRQALLHRALVQNPYPEPLPGCATK